MDVMNSWMSQGCIKGKMTNFIKNLKKNILPMLQITVLNGQAEKF